jgi:hypothetical protein
MLACSGCDWAASAVVLGDGFDEVWVETNGIDQTMRGDSHTSAAHRANPVVRHWLHGQ